jgi:hypothetical protein
MAQIELRHATIRLIDGYSNTALVNDTPLTGDTTVDIDTLGVAEEISIGTRFTVVGSSETYYVTATNNDETQRVIVDATSGTFTLTYSGQTTTALQYNDTAANVQAALIALSNLGPTDVVVTLESASHWLVRFTGTLAGTNVAEMTATDVDLMGGADTVTVTTVNVGGTTRSLTFTPGFLTADGIPADNAAITFAGRTLEIKIGDGNLDYTENRNMDYRLDRGELDTVREGDDVPMDIKLDFVWEFLTAASDDSTPTIEDAFKQRNLASTWLSSATADPCAPYAIDIEIEHVPACEDVEREIILLPDFRWESFEHNTKDAQISVAGKCNSKEAVVSRAA